MLRFEGTEQTPRWRQQQVDVHVLVYSNVDPEFTKDVVGFLDPFSMSQNCDTAMLLNSFLSLKVSRRCTFGTGANIREV